MILFHLSEPQFPNLQSRGRQCALWGCWDVRQCLGRQGRPPGRPHPSMPPPGPTPGFFLGLASGEEGLSLSRWGPFPALFSVWAPSPWSALPCWRASLRCRRPVTVRCYGDSDCCSQSLQRILTFYRNKELGCDSKATALSAPACPCGLSVCVACSALSSIHLACRKQKSQKTTVLGEGYTGERMNECLTGQ